MAERSPSKLGEILVRRNIISQSQLEEALLAQGSSLLPLGSTVLKLGLATEAQVVSALAEQFGVPGILLSKSTLSCEALGVVPEGVAANHHVLPLAVTPTTLNVALARPTDQAILDELAFVSGRSALPFVAVRSVLDDVLKRAYLARSQGAEYWRGTESDRMDVHLHMVQAPASSSSMEVDEGSSMLDAFPAAPPAQPRAPDSKPRILAVDDEEAILDILDRALTHKGMEVIRATRGRQALELLRSSQPDLVLLDAMLPEIHGFELCSQIKRSKRYKDVPVIMISAVYTGWNLIEDVKTMYRADDYITKPFRIMEVVRRVEELLAKTNRSASGGLPTNKAVEEALGAASEALRNGRLEEALSQAQKAVQSDPFDARAHFLMGTTLHRCGRVYEAISEYERVVELAPTQFSALKNLAVMYERQGFRSRAVELWMRALNHSPTDAVRQTIKAHLVDLL